MVWKVRIPRLVWLLLGWSRSRRRLVWPHFANVISYRTIYRTASAIGQIALAGVGRIATGERPYVDFVTPIQTGTFLFNVWAEKLGDGTYQAMTQGAALLIILSVFVLAGILSRRFPLGVALAVAGALTVMTGSQHTIIWHNVLGAFCIAVATWSSAMAPVPRRSHWPWHLLTALALIIGGLTKLNSQLVAISGVWAWALYAGCRHKETWWRVLGSLSMAVFFGIINPLVIELIWTQASLETWWYNVVAVPFSSRAGDLEAALNLRFYFTTRHVYYGPLLFPPLGAVGLLVTSVLPLQVIALWVGVTLVG